MHILIEGVARELFVTCADTGPAPSLTNEKVRAVASGSFAASTAMSLKVIEALAAL
jgi:hypothetical protein